MAPIFRLGFRISQDEQEERDAAEARRTVALAGLAITLALIVASLFLIQRLHRASTLEDCLLSGRSDCDVLLMQLH